jgi:hypothetical protein
VAARTSDRPEQLTAGTFQLGDNSAAHQYRSILSFNTAALPNDAVVTKVTLQIKRQGLTGTNPFAWAGGNGIQVYIQQPSFGKPGLEKTDFNAAASSAGIVGTMAEPSGAVNGNVYTVQLDPSAFTSVNLGGTTQLRLQFATGTNGDKIADMLRFFSGNAPLASRPMLTVEYTQADATLPYYSVGANDGWVLESAVPGTGGSLNNGAATFQLGDNLAGREYRSVLSFNTAPIPDHALITKLTLKIKRQGLSGADPFTWSGNGIQVYIQQPSFGKLGLEKTDFNAAASSVDPVATMAELPGAKNLDWYTVPLDPSVFASLPVSTTTQLRLQFATGTNGNKIADMLRFFSGNAPLASRPVLLVEFTLP